MLQQAKPENLKKDFNRYSIDPASRYESTFWMVNHFECNSSFLSVKMCQPKSIIVHPQWTFSKHVLTSQFHYCPRTREGNVLSLVLLEVLPGGVILSLVLPAVVVSNPVHCWFWWKGVPHNWTVVPPSPTGLDRGTLPWTGQGYPTRQGYAEEPSCLFKCWNWWRTNYLSKLHTIRQNSILIQFWKPDPVFDPGI